MIIVLILILLAMFANYYLSFRLYKEPNNAEYFNNVRDVNTLKMPEIAPDPKYILILTFFSGILIGLFIVITNKLNASNIYSIVIALTIGVLYWIEISRRIKLTEYSLVLSKALSKEINIPLDEIKGIYIYSPNKKFMNGHALTTKLVVSTSNGNKKYTISSLNKKAVLNMIKNNFGVTDYKIFVANK